MTIGNAVIRSFFGYVYVIPILCLYFFFLHIDGKGQRKAHIAAAFLFCFYVTSILTVAGIGGLVVFSPKVVITPFVDMVNGPVDTFLNIVMFIPMGLFLPLMFDRYRTMKRVLFAGFVLSAMIECVQMFGMGYSDINDLMTNTFGSFIGYKLYWLITDNTPPGLSKPFKAVGICDSVELLLFWMYSFLVMMSFQPYTIRALFGWEKARLIFAAALRNSIMT